MSATGQMRILLAEDDQVLRETTKDLLEIFGYAVTAVDDGQAAIENFNQNRPDLVLADITMPRVDGLVLLRHIRAQPSGADLPFVLMSGKAAEADVQRGLIAGANDYVIKPFDPDHLERTIAQLIGGRCGENPLPITVAPPQESALRLPPSLEGAGSVPAASILFVEDDLNIRETTTDLLGLTGAHVLAACCGHEASQILEAQKVDLIITDLLMPNGDGRWLLHHVRSSPRHRHLRVIILSALTQDLDIESNMRDGADAYMTKPFDPEKFLKTVAHFLQLPPRESTSAPPSSDVTRTLP